MKRLLLLIGLSLMAFPAIAQQLNADSVRAIAEAQRQAILTADSSAGWRGSYKASVTFSQASFSSNWAGGGVNSYALASALDWQPEYRRGRFSWGTQLVAEYGLQRAQGQSMRKTADRLLLDSKAAYKLAGVSPWALFGALNVLTQFDVGYNFATVNGVETRTAISRFLAPGFITQSLGFEYRPNAHFSARIGAATLRQTLVLDTTLFRGADVYFGVDRDRRVRVEAGFWLTADYNRNLTETVSVTGKLSAFGNYLELNTVDTRLDVLATAKVWKRLSVTFGSAIVYFKSVDPGVQFSQTLGVGLLLDKSWE